MDVSVDVRGAVSFDEMTPEGQAGKVHGWLNGDQPLVEVYPEIVTVAGNQGITVQTMLRNEVEVASKRQTKDKWVLRSSYYRKSIGAYLMATHRIDAPKAVALANTLTYGWELVDNDKLTGLFDTIDSLSFADIQSQADAVVRTETVISRDKLAERIRKGKYALPEDLAEKILALLA